VLSCSVRHRAPSRLRAAPHGVCERGHRAHDPGGVHFWGKCHKILGHPLACRLNVRQTRFTCIRVRKVFYFRQPCLNSQQLSHARVSHRVWDWVIPHESARKCQSQAQNQDPKLGRLARVARVDEPAQYIRSKQRCTGLLLRRVKMWAKKYCVFQEPVLPSRRPCLCCPVLEQTGSVTHIARTHVGMVTQTIGYMNLFP